MKEKICYLLIVTFFTLNFQSTVAQKLLSYNGDFDSPYEHGQAKYLYYEDEKTYERVKQGSFQYTNTQKGAVPGSMLQKKFTGSFKNGLKNGLWEYVITYTDYVFRISVDYKYYSTGSIILKINYKDGYPTGNCVYSCALKEREIANVRGEIRYGAFKELKHTDININFKDGMLTGPINVTYYLNDIDFSLKRDESILKGQFDTDGNIDGTWKMVMVDGNLGGLGKVEVNAEYKKGWRIKNVVRKFSTGEVINAVILEDKEKKIVDGMISDKIKTAEELNALGYKGASGNLFDEFPIVFNSIYNDTDFLYSTINGDAEMKDGKFDSEEPNGGFYSILQNLN